MKRLLLVLWLLGALGCGQIQTAADGGPGSDGGGRCATTGCDGGFACCLQNGECYSPRCLACCQ